MNPKDLGAARFKEIRQAREQTAKVEAALAKSRQRQEELRSELVSAELRDRQALGRALVDGKAEPASEAAQVKAELAREEERTAALVAAYETASSYIPKLVTEYRATWSRRAEQELGKARSRYKKAITELEAARDAMAGEATLLVWLHSGSISNAANDSLGGRTGVEAVSFTKTLAVLREDCEHLVAHPGAVGDPAPEPRYELAWTNRG